MKYVSHILFALFLFSFAFSACESTVKAPISEEKLINILADIHTAEGMTESEMQRVRDSMNVIYYAQIFEKHGVKSADFDSTMSIYAHYPEQFDSIYARVQRLINEQRDSLHKQ